MPLTKIKSLGITDGTIVNADINASAAIAGTKISGSFGKVLQVVSATKTDTASTQSATFSDVLTASITPTSASNKILIISSTNIGVSDVGLRAMTRLVRDSTAIFIGDTAGSRQRASWQGGCFAVNSTQSINHTFLDSPNTTSAITYKLQFRSELTDVAYSVYINRNWTDSDASNYGRGATSITLMEIQA
jgi:hypothetical protein